MADILKIAPKEPQKSPRRAPKERQESAESAPDGFIRYGLCILGFVIPGVVVYVVYRILHNNAIWENLRNLWEELEKFLMEKLNFKEAALALDEAFLAFLDS